MVSARLAVLSVLLGACGESTLGQPPGGDPMGGEPTAASIWNASSQSVDVSCFGYWIGSMRFVARRDQLSAAQLDMLSNLKAVDPMPGCADDGLACSLSVAQADGSTTTMTANQIDLACGGATKVISFASFTPFRESIGCWHAKSLTAEEPTLNADERCFHGLFIGTGRADPISVTLQIDDTTRTHRIELNDCAHPGRIGKLSFSLLDSDGTTVLGTSTVPADPGVSGTCAALDQTFARSGLFGLEIAMQPDLLPAGDLSFRFY